MIRTWIASIDPLRKEGRYEFFYKMVPAFRQEKADQLQIEDDRLRSVAVWTLLEYARKQSGTDEANIFNLSHSGEYVLCSIAVNEFPEVKVGCDVEQMKRDTPMKIARHFFCPEEIRTIENQADEAAARDTFYRYWVLKESYMKATRQGTAMGLKSFEIRLGEAGKAPCLVKQPEEFSEHYYYKEYAIEDQGYKTAVCSTSGNFAENIEVVCLDRICTEKNLKK